MQDLPWIEKQAELDQFKDAIAYGIPQILQNLIIQIPDGELWDFGIIISIDVETDPRHENPRTFKVRTNRMKAPRMRLTVTVHRAVDMYYLYAHMKG